MPQKAEIEAQFADIQTYFDKNDKVSVHVNACCHYITILALDGGGVAVKTSQLVFQLGMSLH